MKGQGFVTDESGAFCLWGDIFDEKPYGNNKLQGFLAPAIEIITSMLDTGVDWESPHDFFHHLCSSGGKVRSKFLSTLT